MNKDATDRSKQIEAVEFDLDSFTGDNEILHGFGLEIAQAASDAQDINAADALKERMRDARLAAEKAFRKIAEDIERNSGLRIGYEKPWAYSPKKKAAYALWKKVVPMFVQQPETLNIKPSKLAAMLNENEQNFTVTRDMMYDPLNSIAIWELDRILKGLGVSIVVERPTSIRTLQKQLLAREREMQGPADTFVGHFTICGDTVVVNGFPYQIQPNASGKPRIKIGGRHWLPLDTIRAFCTRMV